MFDAAPDDWPELRLKDVAAVNPESLGQRTDPNFAFGYIDISQIERPGVCAGWTAMKFADAPSRARRKVRAGDVLVSTVRPYLRAFATVPESDQSLIASTGFAVVRAKVGVQKDFLFQHIMSEDFVEHLKPLMTGSNYPAVSAEDVGNYLFAVPPLDEQHRITEVLRAVDEALAAEERVLDGLARLRVAAIGRFIAEASLRDMAPLSEITASMDAGWSPDCENTPAVEGEWAILKTSAVTWAGYHDDQNKRLPAGLSPRPVLSVEVGDILITRAGPADRTGVVAMVDQTLGRRMLSDKLIRVRVDARRAVPLTIATILGSLPVQAQIGRVKSGMAASQTNISQRIVAGLEIPLPPLEDQQRFASFVEAIDQQTSLSTAQRKRLSVIKTRIAIELLSGRVRVPA